MKTNAFMRISQSKTTKVMVMVALGLAAQSAMAAGGFANEAKTMVENIRDGIYIVVGVLATVALLWQFAQGFMGRKTWGDILEASMWIVGAGAAIVLGTWLFTKGGSMSF
ncbi:TPA: TrbC/VirB2 family protein [Neisseria meningitidis]|uniref:TrbC/VirB2 family protein n=2 Tax=Neisseria meningitidis TaxID=487 RepID=UPI0002A523CD|nr:TrbC/VirB2 family protein [Neisseria meningitidis]ELK58201.1 trbC/VIRB2 family protein [Neisseria meningitidis NM422]ELK82360.1 trbC/VIRB2 family protein [Neisseria meningitidis NM418]EQD18274.1 trbC/VIRB2 family protein [Neisseria meningitidis NM3173]CWN75710.1 TrbC/VIRB2 family [Neisseria meningitidis]CWR64990.1 TrbC/VIRB2 family [Neisseria meningitidis]